MKERKIIRNRAKCLKCGSIIESLSRHDFMKVNIETVIQQVDGSMAIEGMALSEEDKERIRQTALEPDKVETVIQKLIKKHSVTECSVSHGKNKE